MTAKKPSKFNPHSQRKLAQNLSKQEKMVGKVEEKYIKEHRVDSLRRSVLITSAIVACIVLGWVIGLIPWGVAYISCGEAPITRRNELMIGTVYYKSGDKGYGLASPIFKGGYVCLDSEEYKRSTPPYLR